jgi:metacaspase-1
MAQGISVHVGLNSVDPKHYEGWVGRLKACENDANSMAALCKSQGIAPGKLLTKKATRQAVLKAIAAAAAKLKSGDLFVLTYSGHGGQLPDVSGDEADLQDETWCLFDGELIDDELYAALSAFKAGCKVLVLSDSCHSGTVTRAVFGREPIRSPDRPLSRLMPPDVARATYDANKTFYDGLQNSLRKRTGAVPEPSSPLEGVTRRGARIRGKLAAGVVLISGCQDNQESDDGPFNGAFTSQLLNVWNHGAFKGSHVDFHKKILARMPAYQSPALFTLGKVSGFLSKRPFTL